MPNPYDKGVGSAWGDGGLLPSTLYGASAVSFLQGFASIWHEGSIDATPDFIGNDFVNQLGSVNLGYWEKVSNRGLGITGAQTATGIIATDSLIVAASYGALQFIGTDYLIIEPTDLFVPKHIAYAVVAIVATAVIYASVDYFAQGKGERGQTRKADGTDNPFKKLRADPKKPGNVLVKDGHTGRTISKKAPPGWEGN
jgi:hypothetical protein